VTIVVDDALLLAALANVAPTEIDQANERSELFTTGSWYYRLGRAAYDRSFNGALSSTIDALPLAQRVQVVTALDALPQEIGLLDMRDLVPVMRRLDVRRHLNFLTAEAVATALSLDAAIRVTTNSPLLNDACRVLGVDVQVVSP
jgi:hypothetical protein